MGGGLDLGFRGFGGGLQWVGDPIWVLGVSAVGGGPNLGFGGCGGLGIRLALTVDGYRLLPRFGYGCREREERDKWFFF